MHSNVLSTVVPIHSFPSWCSKLLQSLPSSHHLLSSCTNTSLGPPFLPESATLTQPATQVCKQIVTCSDAFKSQAGKNCKSLAPLYAGQPVAMYDTLHKFWILSTVVCILPKDSYQVCTSDSTIYHCMRQQLCECSVKPTDAVPDTTTATPQAPTRPHVSAPQPAPTKPAQLVQPLPIVPTTPVTPKATDHSCPHHASCPKGHPCTYACDSECSPVQPRRSGQAHIAPKHLIQEI